MLVQTFRDTLPKAKALGGRVVEQLDDIIAQFSGLWNVQHKDDGSHGDITADSIDVLGDITIGGDIVGGDGSDAVFDNIRLRGQNGDNAGRVQFATDEEDLGVLIGRTEISSSPALEVSPNFVPSSSVTYHLGLASRVWLSLWSVVANIGGISGTVQLGFDIANGGLSVDNDVLPTTTASFDLGTPGSGPKRWRDLYLSSAVFEAARTVAMGYWQTVAFNAGNFTASGTMTWTVGSGDVLTNTYTLVGKTMIWSVGLVSTTVAAPLGLDLRCTIPGGFTCAKDQTIGFSVCTNNGVQTPGFAQAVAGQTYVKLNLNIGATNWAASTNNTAVFFTITFDVQ